MNKKGFAPLLIVAILIVAVILITQSGIDLPRNLMSTASLTGSGEYIERPVFKYVKCEATSQYSYSTDYALADAGAWLQKPSVSNNYDVILKGATSFGYSAYRFEYYVCNSQVLSQANCRVYSQKASGTSYTIPNVKNNEVVWAQFQREGITTGLQWKGTSAKYQIGFIPYGLRQYDVLSGGQNFVNPNDCTILAGDDSWKDRFISSDSDKAGATVSKNTNERTLQPEEVRWYVSGYLTSASPSFTFTYQGKQAWGRDTGSSCEIYQINTITVGSGTYKIASPDWSDHLGDEKCCPGATLGDSVCTSSFTWKTIKDSTCGGFQACGSPNWVPYSEKQIIKYACVSGTCQSQTKDVECASNFDCKDSNQVCDLSTFKCVNANVNLDGQVIKTIPDNVAECQKAGGTWVSKTEEKGSLLSFIGITKPQVITTDYCDMNKTNWVKWIIIALIVFALFYFWRPIYSVIRRIFHF